MKGIQEVENGRAVVLGGEHLHVGLHDPMEDAHHLEERAAEPGELGHDQYIIRVQLTSERTEIKYTWPSRDSPVPAGSLIALV